MERFLARHRSLVIRVLSRLDRLGFQGTLVPLVKDRACTRCCAPDRRRSGILASILLGRPLLGFV